ncbi:hypothetical protein GCM10020000_00950 [Streptomyces olivoverticillatus]
MAPHHVLPRRHNAQRPFQEAHVPVGLGTRGDLVGTEGPVVPDGVDLGQGTEHGQGAEDRQEQAGGLRRELREHRLPHDVAVRPARQVPLGVLEVDDQEEMDGHQRHQRAGHEQHVHDVQAGDQRRPPGNGPRQMKELR